MYGVGAKVRIVRGENKGKRGIVTYDANQWGWCNIKTNKGIELKVVPYNVIEGR